MTKCHKDPTSASEKLLPDKNNFQDTEIIDDSREEVEDGRRFGFTIIDNEFIEAGFCSDTISVYLRIIWRAANNNKGFFETVKTTSEKTGISERQLHYCRSLLEYCNIIKITKRYDPNKHNKQISSIITLVDKSKWNLKHEWRNAYKFGSKDYKTKDNNSGLQSLQGGSAATAGGGVQSLQREQDPIPNKITNEQDHPKSLPEKNHKRENCRGAGIDLVKYIQHTFSPKFINFAEGEIFVEQVLEEAKVSLKTYTAEFMKFKEFMGDKPYLLNAIIDIKHFKVLLIQWVQDRPSIIRKFHCEGTI